MAGDVKKRGAVQLVAMGGNDMVVKLSAGEGVGAAGDRVIIRAVTKVVGAAGQDVSICCDGLCCDGLKSEGAGMVQVINEAAEVPVLTQTQVYGKRGDVRSPEV